MYHSTINGILFRLKDVVLLSLQPLLFLCLLLIGSSKWGKLLLRWVNHTNIIWKDFVPSNWQAVCLLLASDFHFSFKASWIQTTPKTSPYFTEHTVWNSCNIPKQTFSYMYCRLKQVNLHWKFPIQFVMSHLFPPYDIVQKLKTILRCIRL